jgi:hypothetical protein
MKKITAFAILFLLTNLLSAQIWFDIGAKVGIGATAPVNGNILNGDPDNYQIFQSYKPSYMYGFKLGVNFNQNHSITPEINFTTLNPMYSSTLITVPTFRYTQIPIIYRKNSDNGGYLEIGPQISLLKSVDNGIDITDKFISTTYDLVLGGGQYIGGASAFGFNLGFRATMPLIDINKETGDLQKGYSMYTPAVDNTYTYKPYRNIFVAIVLEFNLNFGYLQHGANCHPGTRFKLF